MTRGIIDEIITFLLIFTCGFISGAFLVNLLWSLEVIV